MDYAKDILERLLDDYERRGLYRKDSGEKVREVTLKIGKVYEKYRDPYSTAEGEIAAAVEDLTGRGWVRAAPNKQGYYTAVTLERARAGEIYACLGRTPVEDIRGRQAALLEAAFPRLAGPARRFCAAQLERLRKGEAVEFGIGDDLEKLSAVLLALEKLMLLTRETFVRNFSEAVFHDSKRFQRLERTVRQILCAYTEEPVDEDSVLNQYNLFDTPAYILLKGGWRLRYPGAVVDVAAVPGGLGVPSNTLDAIEGVEVAGGVVVSVENLTTYHDVPESRGAVLYLGGFQNTARTELLKKLHRDAPGAAYYHKGDLDPYGFLILENLKQKTGVPFQALEMDLGTLRRCYEAGHFRPLDAADLKAIRSPLLSVYGEVLSFMKEHNCKIEQECFEAMKLGI